ncbi:MAG: gamma-glutamyltransferase, partial [Erysipelotrichales bacterium]|nr:gamma-glutamyltransferase [Erysipelotrichales bacterium]
EYAAARRKQIAEKAMDPHPGDPASYGTVYLCTADKDGNMVSFIQSNYAGFGSGIVIPGTGISLSDRGANFYLDPSSPNCAGPRKKSFHTIIPGFLMKDGKPLGPFGVMGGFMQPQGHVQVLMNMIDFGMDPQEAVNAKRWQWLHDTTIEAEEGFDPEVLQVLRDKGHQIQITDQFTHFGRGQIILRDEDGIYHGASEPRADGKAAGY